jgi:hypothetical protein
VLPLVLDAALVAKKFIVCLQSLYSVELLSGRCDCTFAISTPYIHCVSVVLQLCKLMLSGADNTCA